MLPGKENAYWAAGGCLATCNQKLETTKDAKIPAALGGNQTPFSLLTTEITEDTERRGSRGDKAFPFGFHPSSAVQIDILLMPSLSNLQWKLINSPRLKWS